MSTKPVLLGCIAYVTCAFGFDVPPDLPLCDSHAENDSESLVLLQRSAGKFQALQLPSNESAQSDESEVQHSSATATRIFEDIKSAGIAQCGNERPTQVYMDFDDTYKSSGGSWPAGCDGLYAKGVIYPGLGQFVLEMARGPSGSMRVLRPAVFSARPDGFDFLKLSSDSAQAMAMTAKQTHEDPAIWDSYNSEMKLQIPTGLEAFNYQDGGIERILNGTDSGSGAFGVDTSGSKYGNILDFVDFQKMGETKYASFAGFFAPGKVNASAEACGVWIGDDGQGDCNPGAEKMRRFVKGDRHELGLKVAFIHRLSCSKKPDCTESPEPEEGAAPLIMFDTYLDAARSAHQHGFISAEGYHRVKTSVTSFYTVYCNKDGSTKAPETLTEAACLQLQKSIEKAGATPPDKPKLHWRAAERFTAFCASCCKGPEPNGNGSFEFDGYTFRCHHMYHTTSWWKVSMQAAAPDCQTHCGGKSG